MLIEPRPNWSSTRTSSELAALRSSMDTRFWSMNIFASFLSLEWQPIYCRHKGHLVEAKCCHYTTRINAVSVGLEYANYSIAQNEIQATDRA